MSASKWASNTERLRARRTAFYERGLNSNGHPYRRLPNFVSRWESPQVQSRQRAAGRRHKRATMHKNYVKARDGFYTQGLRSDGRPFRRASRVWAHFRAQIPFAKTWSDIDSTLNRF